MKLEPDFLVAIIVLITALGCSDYAIAEKTLPPYLNICKRFDPEIAKCWKTTFEQLKPHLIRGIPEFKLPPIEPFYIDSLRLNQGGSANINFVSDLSNLTFSGGKDFEVISVDPNYKTMEIKLTMSFPRLTMEGDYRAKGKILLFEIDSTGKIDGDFKQILVNGEYNLETFKKKGKDHLRIKRAVHDISMKSIYLYMHDLFKNNPEITANVNKAINENIDVLYDDFKPLLRDTLGTIITEYTNRAYNQYTFDQLLPVE